MPMSPTPATNKAAVVPTNQLHTVVLGLAGLYLKEAQRNAQQPRRPLHRHSERAPGCSSRPQIGAALKGPRSARDL